MGIAKSVGGPMSQAKQITGMSSCLCPCPDRLVPRRGPDLRNEGGGKIDEYLMRLLRNGLPAQPSKAEVIACPSLSRSLGL